MRTIVLALCAAISASAAQAQAAVSDADLAMARETCLANSTLVSTRSLARNWNAGWEHCAKIETEFERRDLARQAANAAALSRSQGVAERLP